MKKGEYNKKNIERLHKDSGVQWFKYNL